MRPASVHCAHRSARTVLSLRVRGTVSLTKSSTGSRKASRAAADTADGTTAIGGLACGSGSGATQPFDTGTTNRTRMTLTHPWIIPSESGVSWPLRRWGDH
eukprot:3681924-Prymnesium_polylepis.1